MNAANAHVDTERRESVINLLLLGGESSAARASGASGARLYRQSVCAQRRWDAGCHQDRGCRFPEWQAGKTGRAEPCIDRPTAYRHGETQSSIRIPRVAAPPSGITAP